MSRCKPITTRLTFAVAGKRNRIKPLPLAFGRGAGWSNAPIPGSIVPAACWCVGKRRPKIIWLSFIWLVLNSFSTKFWFSDKLLIATFAHLAAGALQPVKVLVDYAEP